MILGQRFEYDSNPIIVEKSFSLEAKNSLERKIRSGLYKFEGVACCVCGGENFERLCERDHHGLYTPVVICRDCGLIQTNPRMSSEAIRNYYNDDYRQMYGDNIGIEFASEYHVGKHIFPYIKNFVGSNPTLDVLEVGCGAGGVLKFFEDNNCNVTGVDVGAKWVEHGKTRYNLNLIHGTVFDLEDVFDVIIYSDTFEHISDVKRELDQIKKLLSNRGVVYLGVPSPKNLSHTYDMDFLQYVHFEHMYHFTLTTLRNLLETNGFKLVFGDEHVRSLFAKGNANRTVVNDYYIMVDYLKKLERFRSKLYGPFPNRLRWYVPYPLHKTKRLPLTLVKKLLVTLGIDLTSTRGVC